MLVLGLWASGSSEPWLFLACFLGLALGFEFVNGFHDTANAVATVIYTKGLPARTAVIWSGICNFVGVHLGGTAVAFSIIHLLPVDLLVSVGSGTGLAMVASLLMAAILWNLGTWYLGLPASSSHTLIGAILGIGLTNASFQGNSLGSGVNWDKAVEVGASLLISPLIGFTSAALLLLALKKVVKDPRINQSAAGDEPPPGWICAVLIGTSTGVSVAHGSNDGQKGVGLIMLILIGILPARFALDPSYGPQQVERAMVALDQVGQYMTQRVPSDRRLQDQMTPLLRDARKSLNNISRISELSPADRWRVRADLLRIDRGLRELQDQSEGLGLNRTEHRTISGLRAEIRRPIDYAPTWVTIAVATALGFGTMIGWRRIVVTIGEKIGKSHLTYALGVSAEVVAMLTIGLADVGGLPVSTTHVLPSGVAGTMAANRSGVQYETLRRIAMAWIFTMPAAMLLAGGLFALLNYWIA